MVLFVSICIYRIMHIYYLVTAFFKSSQEYIYSLIFRETGGEGRREMERGERGGGEGERRENH